jgi:hypothetical protein
METSDWIALGALAVAILGYLDTRRRIRYSEYAFQIEPRIGEYQQDSYLLRNTGTRKAVWVDIDPASVARYELSGSHLIGTIEPGGAKPFWLKSSGELPDTITIKFGQLFRRSRVVKFPQVPTGIPPLKEGKE